MPRKPSAPTAACVARSPGSAPHPAHLGRDVDLRRAAGGRSLSGGRLWPGGPFEHRQQLFRNEARTRRIHVTVALGPLSMNKKALRDDQVQIVLGARHGDVEQAALLL